MINNISGSLGGLMLGDTNPSLEMNDLGGSFGRSNLYRFDSSAGLTLKGSYGGDIDYSRIQPKDLSGDVGLIPVDKTPAPDPWGQDNTITPENDDAEVEREAKHGGHVQDWKPNAWQAEQMRMAAKDIARYESLDDDVTKTRHGEYVAIIDGEVFGFDADERLLKERVRGEIGYVGMLVKRIGTPIDRTVYRPRPRGSL